MAQIPSEQNYIFEESVRSDAAVSESAFQILGGSINHLLDQQAALEGKTLKFAEFLSNTVWTIPEDVTYVILEGCGGGGAGGFHRINFSGVTRTLVEAGFGAPLKTFMKAVTPGASVTITVGGGGTGFGTVSSSSDTVIFGNSGQNTIFDDGTQILFPGGLGGTRIDEMTYLSGSPSSAEKVQNWIDTVAELKKYGRKRHLTETEGMFQYSKTGSPTFFGYNTEGSANGFRGASLVNNGLNTPTITNAFFAGSGPYGASANGPASPNTGAGGSVTVSGGNYIFQNAGSGRLRIAYVSKL